MITLNLWRMNEVGMKRVLQLKRREAPPWVMVPMVDCRVGQSPIWFSKTFLLTNQGGGEANYMEVKHDPNAPTA